MRLGKVIGRKECNFGIWQNPGDVTYLMAADTPNASQVVYAADGYDVWTHVNGKLDLQATNLSAENAAKVVVAEYFLAKAARVLQRDPKQNASEIMGILERGYQSGKRPGP